MIGQWGKVIGRVGELFLKFKKMFCCFFYFLILICRVFFFAECFGELFLEFKKMLYCFFLFFRF
jgi:hypothetical protein